MVVAQCNNVWKPPVVGAGEKLITSGTTKRMVVVQCDNVWKPSVFGAYGKKHAPLVKLLLQLLLQMHCQLSHCGNWFSNL